MIREFYGLGRDPFSLSPSLEFLFTSRAHEEAVAHVAYGLEQNEDVVVIYGDIGTGKTLALHRVIATLSPSFLSLLVSVTTIDFRDIVATLLLKLGCEFDSTASTAVLLHVFEQQIVEHRGRGRKVLLVIDEAQNLSLGTLESIRLLMNLAQPGPQAIQLVLAGQLGLQRKLSAPALRQFKQRIRVEYRFELLNRRETEDYIIHRLGKAGRTDDLFLSGAIDEIFRLSGGVPRLVNHLASKALLAGYVEEAARIGARHVEPLDASEVEPDDEGGIFGGSGADEAGAAADPLYNEERTLAATPRLAHRQGDFGGRRARRGSRWALGSVIGVAVLVAGLVTYPKWSALVQPGKGVKEGPAASAAEHAVPAPAPDPVSGIVATDTSRAAEPAAGIPADSTSAAARDIAGVTGTDDGASPDSQAAAVAPDLPPAPLFVVHVASFREQYRASILEERLVALGVPAFVEQRDVRAGEHWIRVMIGPYGSREAALQSAEDLKAARVVTYSRVIERVLED